MRRVIAVVFVLALAGSVLAAPNASAPEVKLNGGGAGPREIEDTTGHAIVRDYAAAWQFMEQALAQNRADVLSSAFVGIAHDKLAQAVKNQQQAGLRTVYVDHGHTLKAMFYAQEGSSMQLRDVANYELQVFDGGKMIYSEQVTQPYIVVMTPTADHWQVRVMEAAAE